MSLYNPLEVDLECDLKKINENKPQHNDSKQEEEESNVNNLEKRKPNIRSIYLITYSRADLTRYPTRKDFASSVQEAFRETNNCSELIQWVCSMENHQESGFHYHMAVKLSKPRRWLRVKRYLECHKGIKSTFFRCTFKLLQCLAIRYERRWRLFKV